MTVTGLQVTLLLYQEVYYMLHGKLSENYADVCNALSAPASNHEERHMAQHVHLLEPVVQ